jgi:hypothetical protein
MSLKFILRMRSMILQGLFFKNFCGSWCLGFLNSSVDVVTVNQELGRLCTKYSLLSLIDVSQIFPKIPESLYVFGEIAYWFDLYQTWLQDMLSHGEYLHVRRPRAMSLDGKLICLGSKH